MLFPNQIPVPAQIINGMINNNVNGVCQDKENINPLSSLAVKPSKW